MSALRNWLEAEGEKPVVWGVNDCSAFVAQWIRHQYHINLRLPKYDSREAAARLIAKAGGLENIWQGLAEEYGAHEVWNPKEGDFGVIKTDDYGHVGVIFASYGVMIWKGEMGIKMLGSNPKSIIKAWSFQ